jgi:hypothetical protein
VLAPPPRDFEAADGEEAAGLRVPQADLQRLGAERQPASRAFARHVDSLFVRGLIFRAPLSPAAASDAEVLAALCSPELCALVRHIDAAADGEAVRARKQRTCNGDARARARVVPRVRCCLRLALRPPLTRPRTCTTPQALEAAMQQPRFRAFADSVLDALRGK